MDELGQLLIKRGNSVNLSNNKMNIIAKIFLTMVKWKGSW